MIQEKQIEEDNLRNWQATDITICMGYCPGEVLSFNNSPNIVQSRILQHLENPNLKKILLRDTYEIRPYLNTEIKPSSAEIVGAWYYACVPQTGIILLEAGIPIHINPALTLSVPEACGWSEDTGSKRDFLKNILDSRDFL